MSTETTTVVFNYDMPYTSDNVYNEQINDLISRSNELYFQMKEAGIEGSEQVLLKGTILEEG